MPKFLNNIDLVKNELQNAKIHILASDPGSPAEGQIYYNSTDKTIKWYTGSTWVIVGRLDQISAPTADVSLNSHKLTSVTDPTSAQDAATKAYVDAVAAGLKWKQSVRVATTAAGTLASSFENGDTIDGVALATGNRILIKDQADPTANGIYVVAASGAPARSSDADAGAELSQAAVFVEEGTVNADTGWVMTTNGTISIGSSNIVWAQFTGASVTAGAGLTQSGSTLDVGAGTGITVNANDVALTVPVVVANGGTNATTAAGAKTSLGFMTRFAASVGDTSATTIDVTHSMGTKDINVMVYRVASPYDQVFPDVQMLDTNTVRLIFAVAPGTNEYRVVVIG